MIGKQKSCAASTHYVKYSHHPSGRAHFSLDGKVKTEVKKQSVPLSLATGHLFTFMVQGVEKFDSMTSKDKKSTEERGIVEFPFDSQPTIALKFVCYMYSEKELAKIIIGANGSSPWIPCLTPDGRMLHGILLATSFKHRDERRYVILSAERLDKINKDEEVFMTFSGGFDPPDTALDWKKNSFEPRCFSGKGAMINFLGGFLCILTIPKHF